MPTEADSIAAVGAPASVASLTADLRALGVEPGGVLLVHSAMSKLGWVAGGAQAVVEALFDTVGARDADGGTIVMPTQSGQLSDPRDWSHPPVPAEWVDTVRATLPAYDPYLTPTRGMGQVVECFRQHRATVRSAHPTVSFAANGPRADEIVDDHPLAPALGDESPLGRLYDLDAHVLLLGVDHANNTSLHLAEHRADWPGRAQRIDAAPVVVDGRRTWVEYEDLDRDDADFVQLGDAFAATGDEVTGAVGAGSGRLMRLRDVVDFAVVWMTATRPGSLHRDAPA